MKTKNQTYRDWSNGWISAFEITNPEIQDLFYIYISEKYPSIPDMINRDIYKSVVGVTITFLKVFEKDLVEQNL